MAAAKEDESSSKHGYTSKRFPLHETDLSLFARQSRVRGCCLDVWAIISDVIDVFFIAYFAILNTFILLRKFSSLMFSSDRAELYHLFLLFLQVFFISPLREGERKNSSFRC